MPIDADVPEGEVLKRTIPTLLKSDGDGHHIARIQVSGMPPGFYRAGFGKTLAGSPFLVSQKKVVSFAEK